MAQHYFIDIGGNKDGPHDLLTIMRRIRAQKISPHTLVFIDDAAESVRADSISDIALFFGEAQPTVQRADAPLLTLETVLRDALRFTFDHSILTVYAGAMLLLVFLFSAALMQLMGNIVGATIAWMTFLILHYLFFIFTLRLYRMQPFSVDFMNRQLAPALPTLFFAGALLTLMLMGGFVLLVFPALLVAVYYAFVPFLVYDRHMGPVEAMMASRLLVKKRNRRYKRTIALLIIIYVGSLLLIFPIPLATPVFAASLARVYEELSLA